MGNYLDRLLDCYIYLYHTNEYFILPQYPESISDATQSTFASENVLARTAPVFAYSNSGPRTVQVSLNLHRDLLNDLNKGNSSIKLTDLSYTERSGSKVPIVMDTDDYVDILIKKLQAIILPRYNASNSEVEPPRVAVRFGDEIFIKGVINGGLTLNYKLPLIEVNGVKKYAQCDLSFTVSETDPFDADSVGKLGSFRGLTSGRIQATGGRNTSGSASKKFNMIK